MPELPEVETVKETLKKLVVNKTIGDVTIKWENIISAPEVPKFKELIRNQKIHDIQRLGKFLIFILDDFVLISHLRMEGKYFLKEKGREILKHEHVIFHFTDDTELRYHDTRKFGKMHLLDKENYMSIEPLNKVGLEPWDQRLTVDYLKERFEKKTIPIKTTLLDQSIIAGLGNIYVDEVLHMTRLHPDTITNQVSHKLYPEIIENSKKVLEKAIKLGGTTIRSYTSHEGVHGRFQNELLVHQRKGERCLTCGDTIFKITVNGRGTYFCPTCQRK